MYTAIEVRRFVQLAEEALKLKDIDPTCAITGLFRVIDLMREHNNLWINDFILPPDSCAEEAHQRYAKEAAPYYSWYHKALVQVFLKARHHDWVRWYHPVLDEERSEILVSDIRYYVDNYYKIFEKEAKKAENERWRGDGEKYFCMPSTLDEDIPFELDLTEFGFEDQPDKICASDMLASDLHTAIGNEGVRLADEAYVRGFIDAEQRLKIIDNFMPKINNDKSDKEVIPYFSISNSDKEVLDVLKGLKTAEWRNKRKKVIGFVDDDVTNEEWLSALKGPSKNRPAAMRKIPFKAVFICKSFVAQYLNGNYELAEKVFCGPNGMVLKKLRYINSDRNEDICNEKTGQIAKIIRKAMVAADENPK